MKQVSRDKAALGVFAFLCLAALGVLLAYIFMFGHSLNQAASYVDDATGNLDEYTALVYEGTAENRRESVVADSPGSEQDLFVRSLNKLSTLGNASDSGEFSASDILGAASAEEDESKPVSSFEVRVSYGVKNASTVNVDVANPQQYNQRSLVRANGHVYGFLYIDELNAHKGYFDKRVADYKKAGADIIVCLTRDVALLDSYEGATIVISLQDEGLSANGAMVDGVFYDDAAQKGQVGTILVSPSRTITAKDIDRV